jgi:general secretion pathway protein G
MKSRSKNGFTLVEILIVVVILGILAAIVIPQFSQASTEARVSSVKSNLQMVRSQIELYKIQHDLEHLPGAGALDFVAALTSKTNSAGALYTDAMDTNGDASFGPYMQKFPTNANNGFGNDLAEIVINTSAAAVAAAVDQTGWHLDTSEGVFTAIDSAESLTY